jgi:hypothetical protein
MTMPEAYYEGSTARSNNVKRSANPHHIDETDPFAFKQRDARILWNNGWDDKDTEIFSGAMDDELIQVVDQNYRSTMTLVPLPLLKQLYEYAHDGEFDNATGLCTSCGAAVSPVYNETHHHDCEWLKTITAIEAIIAKD